MSSGQALLRGVVVRDQLPVRFPGYPEDKEDALRRMAQGTVSPYARRSDPSGLCSVPDPFAGGVGYPAVRGYRYEGHTGTAGKGGFNLADFGKELLTGFVAGGLSSAAFYGAGKAVEAVKGSVRSAGKGGSDTTRVGRWMSQGEYDKMVASGKVQMSGDNKVHVANPADINAFRKQATKGSIYVEFDVPSNTISKGGTDGWGIINGPGSLLDRLNAKKGLPRITEMPNATNISIEGSK